MFEETKMHYPIWKWEKLNKFVSEMSEIHPEHKSLFIEKVFVRAQQKKERYYKGTPLPKALRKEYPHSDYATIFSHDDASLRKALLMIYNAMMERWIKEREKENVKKMEQGCSGKEDNI